MKFMDLNDLYFKHLNIGLFKSNDNIVECILNDCSNKKMKWVIIGLILVIGDPYINLKQYINIEIKLSKKLKEIYIKNKDEILEKINKYNNIKIPRIDDEI
jgi:hypothetical protein